MKVQHVTTSGNPLETGKLMRQMVDLHWRDMQQYAHLGPVTVFDLVKSVPFRPDPHFAETLQRPLYTMNSRGWGGDCDDKAIAFASYCKAVGIPFKFIAARRKGQSALHHVFCSIYLNGAWIVADPTYPFNALGREREPYEEYVTI